MKKWLNSIGSVDWSSGAIPSADKVEGSNGYENEDGFMSSFTSDEIMSVKMVSQKTYLNNYDSSYADEGNSKFDFYANNGSFDKFFSTLESSINKWCHTTTESFFIMGPEQFKMACDNLGQDYMSLKEAYWLRLPCNTGMSYENVGLADVEKTIGNINASNSEVGVRVAFYLNEDYYSGEIMKSGEMEESSATLSYYSEDVVDFLTNKGTQNVLQYLANDSNFPNSIYTYSNDQKFGTYVELFWSDAVYRGTDGWKDLFFSETSVEEAEKRLVALLDSYETSCKELSEAKTAKRYAGIIVEGFNHYLRDESISVLLGDENLKKLSETITEDRVADMLINQEFDNLIINLLEKENISMNAEINQKLYDFWQSQQMMDSLSKGLKVLDKGLKVMSVTQDVVNMYYQLESLITADEMYCDMLLYLKNNCVYSVVQEAAGNLYDVIHGQMDIIWKRLIAKLATEAVDLAVDEALAAYPLAKIVKSGFDWGVAYTNAFLHTGEIQALKDSMRIEAYVANCLSMWVLKNQREFYASIDTEKEEQAAKEFYYSLYMLWQTRIDGEKTLQQMMIKSNTWYSRYYVRSESVVNALNSYRENIFSKERKETLLGVSVACPVDVEVYDNKGVCVLTLKHGEEISGYQDGIYYYETYQSLQDDYAKYIFFSENDKYSIKCVGVDSGSVDCVISSISDKGMLKGVCFDDVAVENNVDIKMDSISTDMTVYSVINKDTEKEKSYPFEQFNEDDIFNTDKEDDTKNPNEDKQKDSHSDMDSEKKKTSDESEVKGQPDYTTTEASSEKMSSDVIVGMIIKDDSSKNQYRVTATGKDAKVTYVAPVKKTITKLTIPATVKINGTTYKVTAIGSEALKGCSKLKNVKIGKNVTEIDSKAFYKCTKLSQITIPAKVNKIGKQAFCNCKKLKKITIKTTKLTNKNVGSKAFKGIASKAIIKVPKSKLTPYRKLLKKKGVGAKTVIKK